MSTKKSPNEKTAARIFDAETLRRALRRIAHEIIERNHDLPALILAGIPARGVELAQRLAAGIEAIAKVRVPTGVIDVSMHRDDVRRRGALPVVRASQLPLPLEERSVIIVDDVLFTGRTCRAALDAISSFGRPASIQLAVLVDRGHRELPIRPDYVGKNLPTSPNERVRVRLEETDHEPDAVWLVKIEATK
jgi:pyrimidine operon attenuation protein/uracil phosphoribosyltransferase